MPSGANNTEMTSQMTSCLSCSHSSFRRIRRHRVSSASIERDRCDRGVQQVRPYSELDATAPSACQHRLAFTNRAAAQEAARRLSVWAAASAPDMVTPILKSSSRFIPNSLPRHLNDRVLLVAVSSLPTHIPWMSWSSLVLCLALVLVRLASH